MKKAFSHKKSRKLGMVAVAAGILLVGTFSLASGQIEVSGNSLLAAVSAAISGKPTLIINRDSSSPKGVIQQGMLQTLAVYNVTARNVSHWATVQNISGQVVVNSPMASWLSVSSITLQYTYCIPAGKTYGYGWAGGKCGGVNISAYAVPSLSNPVTGTYYFSFSTQVPIYPEASPSKLSVSGVPFYTYTSNLMRAGTNDGKLRVQLVNVSAAGDQCKIVRYGYKYQYGYSKCASSPADVHIGSNGNLLTVLRPYGYGYKGYSPSTVVFTPKK